jgi:hypothetical protein
MKQIQPEYNEKGVRYMMCDCGTYISVGESASNVVCGTCTNKRMMVMFPETEKPTYKPTGRPAGWHFMNEFVDKDGNVFHRGKEQPKLKGTLPPTEIKPKKKTKRRTKEQILIDRHNKKKEVLKKAKKKLSVN